jgi:hypothetical protein
VLALGAAIFIFCFECALLLVVSALARGWRAASEHDDRTVADDRAAVDSPFEDSGVTVEPAGSGVEPLRLRHAERAARSS